MKWKLGWNTGDYQEPAPVLSTMAPLSTQQAEGAAKITTPHAGQLQAAAPCANLRETRNGLRLKPDWLLRLYREAAPSHWRSDATGSPWWPRSSPGDTYPYPTTMASTVDHRGLAERQWLGVARIKWLQRERHPW